MSESDFKIPSALREIDSFATDSTLPELDARLIAARKLLPFVYPTAKGKEIDILDEATPVSFACPVRFGSDP